MKKKKRLRRPITLMEIMIVIVLIGMIGGVVAYNLSGSLNRGKTEATKLACERLKEILTFEVAKGTMTMEDVGKATSNKIKAWVDNSGLGNSTTLCQDAWRQPLLITVSGQGSTQEITVTSPTLTQAPPPNG